MEEDSSYSVLKNSLSSVPAKVLNYSSRLKIANNLNVKLVLQAKSGNARDYRGFAELMGFQYSDIKKFERHEDPTLKILEAWETHPDATLDKLIDFLEVMDRHDVIKEILPLLERDVETYVQKRHVQEIPIQVPEVTSGPVNIQSENDMQLFTRDDIQNGECTYYDAYVSYADEDMSDVYLLANYLESPEIGLKLFLRDRDMLAGCTELDATTELIKNRCGRMLIFLTSNYSKSSACEFQTSFAASLAIDQSQRILIPVMIEPCEVPLILKYVSKIDFTKPGNITWVYEKLVNSLLPAHRTPMYLSSLEKNPHSLMPPKLRSLRSHILPENTPAITFPPSSQQLTNSVDESAAIIPCAPVSSENGQKNSSAHTTRTKKSFLSQLQSQLKKARSSSSSDNSGSISSSSSATSGYNSQTRNAFENFESLMEGNSDTSL